MTTSLAPPPRASSRDAPQRPFRWPITLGLLLANLAAYQNALSVPFLFDDRPAIERNESIRQLWPLAAGQLVVGFHYAIGGLEPRGYYLFNLLAHAVTGLVLWDLLQTWSGFWKQLRCAQIRFRQSEAHGTRMNFGAPPMPLLSKKKATANRGRLGVAPHPGG